MGFIDLRSFNTAMLAKQGWKLLQNQESLVYRCFKAQYFPRCSFLEANSPHSSHVWKSIMAGQPILKRVSCWKVDDGSSKSPLTDKWIPNHPSNKVLFPPNEDQSEWRISEFIDPSTRCWDREYVLLNFQKEDAEAILRIPLSHRHIKDSVMWLHTQKGTYTIKSTYHVVAQLVKEQNWAKSSRGSPSNKEWEKWWKLKIPNKIKVIAWRVGLNILPSKENLFRSKIAANDTCTLCKSAPESELHSLWECGVARDVWADSVMKLQKFVVGQYDVLNLFKELLLCLNKEEFELFLVQAWFIWSQRNRITYGGVLQALA